MELRDGIIYVSIIVYIRGLTDEIASIFREKATWKPGTHQHAEVLLPLVYLFVKLVASSKNSCCFFFEAGYVR